MFHNDKRDLPERKMPYKGELQNNMRDVVVVVSTLVSFLCWKNVSSESCDWTAPYFSVFLREKKKKNWAGRPREVQETSCANYNLLVYKTSHDTMNTLEYTERTWHFKVLKSRGKTNWK